jgi:hypothetical protein
MLRSLVLVDRTTRNKKKTGSFGGAIFRTTNPFIVRNNDIFLLMISYRLTQNLDNELTRKQKIIQEKRTRMSSEIASSAFSRLFV